MKDKNGNKWLCINAGNRLAESILRRLSASNKYHKEQTAEQSVHDEESGVGEISALSGHCTQQCSEHASPPHSEKCI